MPPAIGIVFGVSRKPSDSVGAEAAWAPSPPLGSSYFILSFMLHQCQSSLRPLVCRTSGPWHMSGGLLSASRCHPFPRCSHALRPGERSTPPPLPEWLPCGVPRRACTSYPLRGAGELLEGRGWAPPVSQVVLFVGDDRVHLTQPEENRAPAEDPLQVTGWRGGAASCLIIYSCSVFR